MHTKDFLQTSCDYVVIAVEKEKPQKEIEDELLFYGIAPERIIKGDSVIQSFCQATTDCLLEESSMWENIYQEYKQYALGNFGYFDFLI